MKRWHFILLSIGACALCYSWGYSNAPLETTTTTVRVPACEAYPLPKRTRLMMPFGTALLGSYQLQRLWSLAMQNSYREALLALMLINLHLVDMVDDDE